LDLDISDNLLQGSASKSEISIMNESTERAPSPTVASNLPAISVTKAPAPLPVRLPTARDIVSLPSPPPSQNPSLEDLESGRVNGMRELSEDVGLVTSARKMGKTESLLQLDASDATAPAIPTTTPPLISPTMFPGVPSITFSPNFPVPDLLADLPSMGKEPIGPSPLAPVDPLINPDTSRDDDDLLVETTIRLVGGGGEVRVAEIPVASSLNEEQPPSEASKDVDAVSISPSEAEAGSKPDEKLPKKSKSSSLASLKKLGQLGRTIKRDSMSSVKGIISPRQNT
jgi:hypothetical protein